MILDTHVLLWYLLNDNHKLSDQMIDLINFTKNTKGIIASSITL